jgi:hypothetical protein
MIRNRTYHAEITLELREEQKRALLEVLHDNLLDETFDTLFAITRLMGVLTFARSAYVAGVADGSSTDIETVLGES